MKNSLNAKFKNKHWMKVTRELINGIGKTNALISYCFGLHSCVDKSENEVFFAKLVRNDAVRVCICFVYELFTASPWLHAPMLCGG